jgi:hypothetical protein
MRLVAHIHEALADHNCDESVQLADIYLAADAAGKDVLDQAFTCLCGCKLKELMGTADLDDTTTPESHWSEEDE